MMFKENGMSREDVIARLKEITSVDQQYETGRILGSMCTYPHEFAVQLGNLFPEKNLGDPGLFPGTTRLEEECIQMLGEMLGEPRVVGNIVTGGSEANIVAMRVARKLKRVHGAEIIVPESAHASFYKAADFMNLKLRVIRSLENYQPDLDHLAELINPSTIAVVGIAGTTSLGLVDPIKEMGETIEDSGQEPLFHVDAAFGGFVLPFLEDLGHQVPPYNFSVPQVSTMTCDPHKMGMNLIPSGGFLLREIFYHDKLGFDIPYLAGGAFKHFNIMGTRPGSVVVSCWGLMKHLGREGFKRVVKKCWDNTVYLRNRIKELDRYIDVAHEPVMNVLGIKSLTNVNIKEIDARLRKEGWFLGLFENMDPPIVRIVLMPHVSRHALDEFMVVLERILKELNGR